MKNLSAFCLLPSAFPIDMVYTWVDGYDPKWLKKKNEELKKFGRAPVEATGNFRFDDNDELKFSLRSIEKFAPWVNKIFIITYGQTPKWLNTKNPKIKIIDHKDIMPKDAMPCFNSSLIESFMMNIPSLSEHFIYGNDDMLFMARTSPSYFFSKNGTPIIRVNNKKSQKEFYKDLMIDSEKFQKAWDASTIHVRCKLNSIKMIYNEFGDFNYAWTDAHNIDPYRKSDMISVKNIPEIKKLYKANEKYHFRDDHILNRIIFHMWGVAHAGYIMIGRDLCAKIKQLLTFRFKDQPLYAEDIKKVMGRKIFYRKLTCVEDPTNPKIRKSNHDYLSKMFPNKSRFEK